MLNRIFMFVYALVNIFVGVGILLVATRTVGLDMLRDKVEPVTGTMSFIAAAACFILLSLIALFVSMYSGGQKKVLVHGGANGEVHMSVGAIGKMVERLVSYVDGLSNVKVEVKGNSNYLKVIINADASPDCKVSDVTAIVQEKVKEGLAASLGREINKVDVRIKDVKQPL